jgi:hypothetical protein
MEEIKSKGFLREVICGPAAIVVLIAFFLPWITVSCDNGYVEETFSGYDLTQDQSADEETTEEGDIALWGIPLMAIGILVVVWLRYQNSIPAAQAAILYPVAGGIGLIIQFLKYLSLRSDVSDAEEQVGKGVIKITYEIGWWLTGLALVTIIVSGYVASRLTTSTGPPPDDTTV